MTDEDLRREERLARAGAPSVRRLVELGRLASALRAVEPTEEEIVSWRFVVGSLPEWLPRASVGAVCIVRRVINEQAEHDPDLRAVLAGELGAHLFRQTFRPPREDYGPPTWLSALESAAERVARDVDRGIVLLRRPGRESQLADIIERWRTETEPYVSRPSWLPLLERPARALTDPVPWFSRSNLPERRDSDPATAPARSALELDLAIRSIPPAEMRRWPPRRKR